VHAIATAVHCVAPAHAPGSVAVTATNAAGNTAMWTSLAYITRACTRSVALSTTTRAASRSITTATSSSARHDRLARRANKGGFDAVLVKYDVTGQLAWIRQLGTPAYDYARDVAVDPQGNATNRRLHRRRSARPERRHRRRVIARYAPDGTLLWVTQTGSPGDDQGWDVAVDDAGNTVVAVQTTGQLKHDANAGGTDGAILHYTSDGTLDWAHQFRHRGEDYGHSVTITPDGVTYLVGYTNGALFVASAGGMDYFVARYEANGTQTWIRQHGGHRRRLRARRDVRPGRRRVVVGRRRRRSTASPTRGAATCFSPTSPPTAPGSSLADIGARRTRTSWARRRRHGAVYVECVTQGGFDGQTGVGGGDFCMVAFDHRGTPVTRIGARRATINRRRASSIAPHGLI